MKLSVDGWQFETRSVSTLDHRPTTRWVKWESVSMSRSSFLPRHRRREWWIFLVDLGNSPPQRIRIFYLIKIHRERRTTNLLPKTGSNLNKVVPPTVIRRKRSDEWDAQKGLQIRAKPSLKDLWWQKWLFRLGASSHRDLRSKGQTLWDLVIGTINKPPHSSSSANLINLSTTKHNKASKWDYCAKHQLSGRSDSPQGIRNNHNSNYATFNCGHRHSLHTKKKKTQCESVARPWPILIWLVVNGPLLGVQHTNPNEIDGATKLFVEELHLFAELLASFRCNFIQINGVGWCC